jgi:sodium transport system ATP-binding protein
VRIDDVAAVFACQGFRVIQVEALSKAFFDYQRGWKAAISDISFECRPGEIFGLLGPNGAGKTTTLRILSTVLRPSSGRAVVGGHDVVSDPQGVRARIGYMSATTGIYDRMTAWELVEHFGRLYGMPRERLFERMEAVFGWLKMNDFRDVLGAKMSTGMKQKVSIARTIIHDPPVLIFDEPTSGLDVLVARVVLQKILELRNLGKTIVFSTHSMHEVEKLCNRVAIIHKGRVQAAGAPADLLQRFDQPDLEELFFYLVERADSAGLDAGPGGGVRRASPPESLDGEAPYSRVLGS